MIDDRTMPANIVSALITTYFYNRDNEQVKGLIQNIIYRLGRYNKHSGECSEDDVDIAYGYLVLLYGDYGTSPRHGWIDSPWREIILKELKKQLESINKTIEISRSTDED